MTTPNFARQALKKNPIMRRLLTGIYKRMQELPEGKAVELLSSYCEMTVFVNAGDYKSAIAIALSIKEHFGLDLTSAGTKGLVKK